ncbi:MAG TPA: histidine phosphatase family protein [Micropepsaceae bacterium]|nr:histidine phosphatase family protein [Micropepsaceae bacterium]
MTVPSVLKLSLRIRQTIIRASQPSFIPDCIMRIILVRHGEPKVDQQRWIGHKGFMAFMDAYRDAGLTPESAPPDHLAELTRGMTRVFTSELPRSIDSARALLPDAEFISDEVFTEAPLAPPRIPGLRLKVPGWAVVSRVAWHGGYSPRIENFRQARRRAQKALHILLDAAAEDGAAVLVGHGYFNAILGRMLRLKGFARTGSHRAEFWNTVIYDRPTAAASVTRAGRRSAGRPGQNDDAAPLHSLRVFLGFRRQSA